MPAKSAYRLEIRSAAQQHGRLTIKSIRDGQKVAQNMFSIAPVAHFARWKPIPEYFNSITNRTDS